MFGAVTLDLNGFDDASNLSAMGFRFIVHLGGFGGRFGYRRWLSARGHDGAGRVWHFEPLGDDPDLLTCILCELPPSGSIATGENPALRMMEGLSPS